MNTQEERLRALLAGTVPADPPPPRLDLAAARRTGRRKLRARRAGASGAAFLAMGAVAAIALTVGVGPLAGGAGPASSARPARHAAAKPRPLRPPRGFDMLTPYAAFGYLPSGFTVAGQSQAADATSVDLTALRSAPGSPWRVQSRPQPFPGEMLMLSVYPAGACHVLAAPPTRGAGSGPSGCELGPVLKPAPRVLGRPAYWMRAGLIWEYAPKAWASLNADLRFFSHARLSHRRLTAAQLAIATRASQPPSGAAARSLLRVAEHVRYARTTPIRFPFRLIGAAYANWRLTQQVGYEASGRLLLGNTVTAGPAGRPRAVVDISVTPSAGMRSCKDIPGQTRPVTVQGVPAVLRILDSPPKQFESLCVPDLHGMSIYLDEEGFRSLTVLARHLVVLGTDPSRWTTNPLP